MSNKSFVYVSSDDWIAQKWILKAFLNNGAKAAYEINLTTPI